MKCSICGNTINDKYGNNAQPINDGRCCDDCNISVIIERIKEMSNDNKWIDNKVRMDQRWFG